MTTIVLGGIGMSLSADVLDAAIALARGEGGVESSRDVRSTRRLPSVDFRENGKSSRPVADADNFDPFYGCLNCGERDGLTAAHGLYCHDCREDGFGRRG